MTAATDSPAATLPPAILAATVIVVRDGDAGLEVLLLKRSAVGMFANLWVFPGGRVDHDDDGDDDIERARSAAAREAAEEVAIHVDRQALVAWSHWTPPPVAPKRYNTWFFIAPWAGDSVVIDGHEIVDHVWISPAEALSRRFALAPPTHVSLAQLTERSSVAEIVELGPPRGVEFFATKTAHVEGQLVLFWHGDAGYESGDLDAPGSRHRITMRDMILDSYERFDVSPSE